MQESNNRVKKNLYFFGNFVFRESEEEREEVRDYLYKWYKYLLRTIPEDAKLYPDEETSISLIEREKFYNPQLAPEGENAWFKATSALRVCFEFDGPPGQMRHILGYTKEHLGKDENQPP